MDTSALPTSSRRRKYRPGRVLILVLTYNEVDNLPRLLEGIVESMPDEDILVIDDDSPDGTGTLAREIASEIANLRVIVRQGERGLGSALRAGIVYAIQHKYDFLLNLDADLSHNPADLPRLRDAAISANAPCDVVIGSRYVKGGRIHGWPLRRRMMSRLVNCFASRSLRLPARDCSGAFRCYRIEQLKKLNLHTLRSNGYSIQEELLLRLYSSGATIEEIPITFVDRQRGNSKLTAAEALRSMWQLIHISLC